MNKNAIKKFATEARRELISRVSQKASKYGIVPGDKSVNPSADSYEGYVFSPTEKNQRIALIKKVEDKGYEQVIEEVAYTWFNRFVALRFMEVNGYLPTRVRVFTNSNNEFKPQILTEATQMNNLEGLDVEKVYKFKEANDDEGLYKYLLITQCNALNAVLPDMFQNIKDYTELLFPDDLLQGKSSVIRQMIELIPEEDWKDAVQIIGWLYQYYNSEKKDEVFAKRNSAKISKENIPAATQLFTPDWIVRYMVENSLGRLWLEGHPNDDLKSQWKYYLEDAKQPESVQAQLDNIREKHKDLTPEDLLCIDPCSGSGHVLTYMFDVLVQIYETYGYTTREAVSSIVKNNLYGLDIDKRAAQLAYFSIMMKACQYDRRFLKRGIKPHIYAITESNHKINDEIIDEFSNGDSKLKEAITTIKDELYDAKEYGSILTITPQDWDMLYARLEEVKGEATMYGEAIENLRPLIQVAQVLSQKYDVVVTNPPYMGSANMNAKLTKLVKKKYPDSKRDLFAVFIERCNQMVKKDSYYAMVTQHSWMFLSSFEKLRDKLLENDIVNMAHLGARAFEEIGGEVVQTTTFTVRKSNIKDYNGKYCRLIGATSQEEKEKMFLNGKNCYVTDQNNFSKIPGNPVAYWVSDKLIKVFKAGILLQELAISRNGMKTGNNEKFLRLWWESNNDLICFDVKDISGAVSSNKKWFAYNKGGGARKWYGNNDYIVNWENRGHDIFVNAKQDKRNVQDYPDELKFTPSVTWSLINSGTPTFRYKQGNLSDIAGMSFYKAHDKLKYLLAFCNTNVASKILKLIAPTMNFQAGDVGRLPILQRKQDEEVIKKIVDENILLSQQDWDTYETSWGFKHHPLIRKVSTISEAYDQWKSENNERFDQLKANEEELNRIFIDIYGLQDELTPEVADKDVTVHKIFDSKDDVPETMKGSKYIRTKYDEVTSFISYAVGCIFGRYSLDVDGLAYAGGNWDNSKYTTFAADKDSIIPISDDEYFDDDIVNRLVNFVKVVYGEDTLQENLKFIADALGGKGHPKEVIRNYFLNKFYKEHCKTYRKRPIYWLFDSGKKNGFKCLVYMHRYQPDTIARIRTDYVHEQQARYYTIIEDLEARIKAADTSEKIKLKNQLKVIKNQDEEIKTYEEKIHHLADQMISIDLDDGVKNNYELFKDVLAKIR
ncbi:BREX-1 system adenine-specific DNA-methyltransferase PglX [Ligilactobacillus salivarius]|uniref:BREX-1 system adenine-specific DNA-methyltransferase PglX n=1 Tax=Ligilactobacillus salivarius TaxID=1624 RepID=UPI001370FEFA|nr:BREX-1 system adenine-specific DNA-methyltransferase PglX [Ligilactobacillus salivarius]MYU69026.1 BREX-1 system adenine-specific DNA-methyltransferase PglX [Ligilactobacillus salivarius]MYU71385.1 BREX-1 system adenine-specific DNA-methyltransferase PglX [Ligilactobacillus salivarius]MYU77175.1 BREX-1 system adenine-specific DNA-methyltransferase PglX [Ligilactobacillus salivarius]MYU78237.1 BREX-1 system adenine-specific DNA-methyltransferase PglX [Ligilactobacillus salivarius]MYV09041.1 